LLSRLAPGREVTFTRDAARVLFAYDWRYNIRELQRALDLAIASFDPSAGVMQITEMHLPRATQTQVEQISQSSSSRFRSLAVEHAGNVTALARALGTSRSHVRRLARRYDCDLEAVRGSAEAPGRVAASGYDTAPAE
jgi:transcriptional regulator of acetoin/glycerol metabolism